MSDYKKNWPAVDEMLIERLEEMFPLTDGDLRGSEWDRAYLAGQRSAVAKLKGIHKQQQHRDSSGSHDRI